MPDTASLSAFFCLFASQSGILCAASRQFVALSFLAAFAAAFVAGIVTPFGIAVVLAGLSLAAVWRRLAREPSKKHWRALCIVPLALLALALGFHAVPGFTGQVLMTNFGREASQTLAWQFDKGIGGVLLLMVCGTSFRTRDYYRLISTLLACPVVLIAFALLSDIATFDPRWLPGMAMWLIGNLFLTVIAEEAFFRGLLQQHLVRWLERRYAYGAGLGIAVVAMLFAVVHALGGHHLR